MRAYELDTQGRWVALVRADAALMLPRTADGVRDLWPALAEGDPIGAVLGRLTRDGLADVPPFAMVAEAAGRRRVIVRGGFRVLAGDEEITAAGVSTWVERTVGTEASFEIVAPFAAPADDAEAWPIETGLVPASVLRSAPTTQASQGAPAATAATAATAEPAAAAEPVAAAEAGSRAPAADTPPAPVTAETPVVAEETMVPEQIDDSVDDETIIVAKPAAAAPIGPVAGAPAVASAPAAADGDHDGLTIAVTALQELRGRAKRGGSPVASASGPADDPADAPTVTLRLPGGSAETLTGEIVLGRSPSVSRASGTRLPRLITIGAGDPDISRSHVRIGLEGGTVVVTDLHSRNGTSVVQPGRAPVKLRAGEPTPVLVGTVVDLGGGCEITVVAD